MKAVFKLIRSAILLLVLVCLAGAGIGGFLAFQFLNSSASNSNETVIFEIVPGETFKTVAHRLEREHLVSSASKLQLFARFTTQAGKMRVGEYAIRRDAKPREVLAIITSGHSVEHVITFSEGLNIFEVAQVFEKNKLSTHEEFLRLVHDPKLIHDLLGEDLPTFEGYLFPETYNVTKFTGARGLVKMMVERFKDNYSKVSQSSGWNQAHLTRHQLVTLASIVEKETGAPEERPVISSVFHNRLKLHMKLQTDPTVIYGIWERDGKWNGSIGRHNLLNPTRYNTYTLDGLPYGPIASPGAEAIKAAGLPAQSNFLFFVSKNNGTHTFSQSYGEHQTAVNQFLSDRRAHPEKSWRDLGKRKPNQ